ncbi:MAG: replicative DNA helicase [Ktedonobacteraceae bacterium]
MEKLLPQNIEAECGVLGSIIIDPEAIVQVADFLQAEDFYRDAHRNIYEVIMQLYEEHEAADFITICDELERRNKLEGVGGASYITSLINQVPTSGNVEYYGHIVERNAILRRLIHAAGQIAAVAYEEADADVALDKAEQLIFNISQRHAHADFSLLRDILSDYMNKLDQLHERRGTIVGVPTGFTDLDRLTGGLQKSDLIILAARPAVGKTSLALSLAHNSAIKHQSSIAVFSLEMSKEQLVQRLLSMDAGVDQQRLRTGWIEDDEWDRIVFAMGTLSEANIWIDDTAGISSVEMRSKARRLQAERGIDLIIVDYLQLMQSVSNSGRRNENRVQEISEISRNLKGLARELNVPVLALAQLSRAVESRQSKVPQLSDLRESGCLTGDTPIYLPDLGTYQPIEKLVGQKGFKVLALNTDSWRLEPCTVSNAFATGHKAIYRMTTRLGRTVRATANHKFLTLKGWQQLDELSQGSRISVMGGQRACKEGYSQGIPYQQQLTVWQADRSFTRATARVAPTIYGQAFPAGRGSASRVVYSRGDPCSRPGESPCGYPGEAYTERFFWERGDGVRRDKGQWGPCACPRPVGRMQTPLPVPQTGCRTGTRPPHPRPRAPLSLRTNEKLQLLFQKPPCVSPGVGNEAKVGQRDLQSDIYWDEILSIEPDGEAEVYDLTVDRLHNFVAGDIIVHNSIEQDADIVMFIYRDDVYNPESERKNIADIIIAKHRNGPVGEVSLYFQASQTRFHDLEVSPPTE